MCLHSELKSPICKVFHNTFKYINSDFVQIENKNEHQLQGKFSSNESKFFWHLGWYKGQIGSIRYMFIPQPYISLYLENAKQLIMPFEYCYSLQGFGFLFVLFCFVLPFQILFHRFYLFLGNCLEACKLCIFLNLFHYLFLLSCLSLFFYHLALSLFFTFSLIFFKFFFLIPCFLSSSFLPSCTYSLVFLFFPIFFSITFVFHQEKKCVSYSNFSDYRSVFDARKRVKKI